MILKRVKLLTAFRGLPAGYEIRLNPRADKAGRAFEPICFVGLNGSGKSNVLEMITEIFYYLETYHKAEKTKLSTFKTSYGFEIDYHLPKVTFDSARVPWDELSQMWDDLNGDPIIRIIKPKNEYPIISAIFPRKEITLKNKDNNRNSALLPSRVIAYSSGMNELLSNPFIKIDFQYFDELESKVDDARLSTLDMNRLFYLNYDSNKYISISNFLFDADDFDISKFEDKDSKATDFGGINLTHIKKALSLDDIASFSICLKMSKKISDDIDIEKINFLPAELNLSIDKLKKCTPFIREEKRKTKSEAFWEVKLFFWINKATKNAFRYYFKTAYELYRQLYFLQLMNNKLISKNLRDTIGKAESRTSEHLSELLPKFETEKLVFYVSDIAFKKKHGDKIFYRNLSDGEHQLLQILGSLLLMDHPGALFLFDEPETHYNPDWRSKFVDMIHKSIDKAREQELLLTTHSPFIVSDCRKENVFKFVRTQQGKILPPQLPEINTFGTSVSILTERIFDKEDTISEMSKKVIDSIRKMPLRTLEDIQKAKEASREIGESVEKILLFRELLLKENELKKND